MSGRIVYGDNGDDGGGFPFLKVPMYASEGDSSSK